MESHRSEASEESPDGSSDVSEEELPRGDTIDGDEGGPCLPVEAVAEALASCESGAPAPGSPVDTDPDKAEGVAATGPSMPVTGLFQHKTYMTLHVGSDDDKLFCRRRVSERYVRLEAWPRALWHRCKHCASSGLMDTAT